MEEQENQEVVGQGNPRDEYRKQLAEQHDEAVEQSPEFQDVTDDSYEPRQHVEEAPQEPKKYTITVNGKQRELTEEQLLQTAAKVEAADEYLSWAKQQALAQQQSAPAPVAAEDDLALARAIQMGSEQEAVEAIRKLKSPSIRPDDVARQIDERLNFNLAVQRFRESFPDIVGDPFLYKLAAERDDELARMGQSDPATRMQAVGNEIREWVGRIKPAQVDKAARKATITPLPTASARNAPPADDDVEENPRDVIRKMAAARGQ